MKPTRPYLVRAFYDWILDSGCTPYVVVNATLDDVVVPTEYIENGQIVLNVSMDAVRELTLDNECITFSARFNGVAHNVYVPMAAVMAIYASENGKGMVFTADDANSFDDEDESAIQDETSKSSGDKDPNDPKGSKKGGGKKGHLTVVK